ncbi:MAG: CAP domain-containing protein [Clostridiaceae bacterium]|nr:CAP domain-containing protein [Clostridiaceae bacterium]
MKKPIIIAALVLILANFVNQTTGVAARGVLNVQEDDFRLRLTVNQQTWEGEADAGGCLKCFGLRQVEPVKGLRVFDEMKTEETSRTEPAQTQPARPEPTAPSRKKVTTGKTLPPTRTTTTTEPSATTTVTTATKPPPTTKPVTTTETTTTIARTEATSLEATTSAAPATTNLNGYYCSDFETEVIRLVNIERAANGAGPVTMNASLRSSAAVRALEIVEKFSHERPDGTRWVTAIKVKYGCAGENLAAGQRTPANVVNAWMNSDAHRKNLLNPKYSEIGVACYHDTGTPYKYYWVQIYVGYGN